MAQKTAIELENVQVTLLLPLWGRAEETKKARPRLEDETAIRVISRVDYDFSLIARNVHPVTQLEWICRSIHIDKAIQEFLVQHPRGTIVNIGAGLDTTFERVDNCSLLWYDLDFPEVIALRRKFIDESDRRKFVACSFFDESWIGQVRVEDGAFFMAAGVFYYFEESQLKHMLGRMATAFPGAGLIFDACSPVGVKAANEQLIRKVGLDEKSFLKWAIWKADEMLTWGLNFAFIREYPMYKHMKQGLTLKNKLIASVADHYKMMYMIHLKFAKSQAPDRLTLQGQDFSG